jgi:hypothetical protein
MTSLNAATLADQYAIAKQLQDAAERETKRIRDLILAAHPGSVEFVEEGDSVDVVVGFSTRTALVADRVKALLTPSQIADCSSFTTVQSLRVKPRLRVAA